MNFRELLASLGIDVSKLPNGVLSISDPRLTPSMLGEIKTALGDAYKAARTPAEGSANMATLRAIRDAERDIDSEVGARAAAEAAAAAELIELAELDAAGTPPAPAAPVAGDVPVAPAAAPADAGVPAAAPNASVAIAGIGVTTDAPATPEPQLAMVASAQLPANKPGGTPDGTPTVMFHTASAASVDLNSPIPDLWKIGSTIMEMGRTMADATTHGQVLTVPKVVLASVPPVWATPGISPDGILSTHHTAAANTDIIVHVLEDWGKRLDAAKHGTAHTAAAPWCEPFDQVRALPTCVTTDTPVRNSIPFIPMGHGGFTFNQGYVFDDLWGAVDIWTPADQALIDPTDPSTWKRCMSLFCPDTLPQVSLDDWLTACLEWQVGMDINNPERFAQAFMLLDGVRARLVEQYTLSIIDTMTKNYKNSNVRNLAFGGVVDLVGAIIAMFQGSTYNGRSTGRAGYTMYLDTDMLDTMVLSEIRAAHAKTNGTKAGIIRFLLEKLDFISAIVEVKDRIPGAYGTVQSNGNPKASAAFPADNIADTEVGEVVTAGRIRIVPTAEAFFFGTGELRTGVRQDYSYARQNKVGWFAEEAFAGTKYGCQPWFALNATITPRGYYVGAINRNLTQTETDFATPLTWVGDNGAADEPDPRP